MPLPFHSGQDIWELRIFVDVLLQLRGAIKIKGHKKFTPDLFPKPAKLLEVILHYLGAVG
jgi:hypothetical protein